MPETFLASDAAELAVVERSGFIESRHVGSAVVMDANGQLITTLGDVNAPIFPRSTLKPFQALASLQSGIELTQEQVAISCASHAGTPRHVALVREILADAGLDDRALQCPAAWPGDRTSRDTLVKSGEPAGSIYMNCSGKHAAMLAACVKRGYPLDSYLDYNHPLQASIRDVLERVTAERPSIVAVDGCGAPVYGLSLTSLARGVLRLMTANEQSPFPFMRYSALIRTAMLAHPWAVDGPGRDNTVVMEQTGVLAKLGAEGVLVLGAPNGTVVTLKMLDGASRASTVVGLRLLEHAGALSAATVENTLAHLDTTVLGGGHPVGSIRPGRDLPEVQH